MRRLFPIILVCSAAGLVGAQDFRRVPRLAPRLTMGEPTALPRRPILHQRRPAVAYGKGVYFIVWQEGYNGLGGASDILGLRLDQAGRAIDQAPIPICTNAAIQESPAVAYCDGQFLVAWSDFRNGTDYDLYATLVTAAGDVKTPDGFLLSGGKGAQAEPAVASNGKDQFLVAWQDFRSREYMSIFAARVAARSGEVMDKDGFIAMPRGEKPVVVHTGGTYVVGQKWYAALVGENGAIKKESWQLWNSKTVLLPAATTAWGKALVFFNTEPWQDPWGWGGNGAIIGVSVTPDGQSPEAGRIRGQGNLSALEADGKVINCLDAARWRNHTGWPMGMPGGFKGTHEGTWPNGPVAAAYNGRSAVVVWSRAHVMDRRRLVNRDLYLRRVLDGWAYTDATKVRIVAGPTDESTPVLAAGPPGDLLLAYETVLEEGGVAIEYRLLTEEEDRDPPAVAYVAPLADDRMLVAFDEPVDPATAGQAAHYAIDGLAVKSATFNTDHRALQREVILETDPQTRGRTYTLTVTGVRDQSANANAAAGKPFEYLAKPGTFERSDFVARWAVRGTFPNKWDQKYIDPAAVRPSPGKDGWRAVECGGGCVLDLVKVFGPSDNATAYANAYVFSEKDRDVLVRIDSNDGNRAWLNGVVINSDPMEEGAGRGFHDYTNEVPARLKAGWNQLTVRVGNRVGFWLLAVQVTDWRKRPIRDLTWQLENPFEQPPAEEGKMP